VWWLEHPGRSREELVDLVMDIAWAGLRHRYPKQPGRRS